MGEIVYRDEVLDFIKEMDYEEEDDRGPKLTKKGILAHIEKRTESGLELYVMYEAKYDSKDD
ncbi:hypothetical protein CL618_01490 [archaeon]|nr:hypothetical protein [archaeon]